MNNRSIRYIALFIIGFGIVSCDSSRVYEDYNDLEEAFWHIDSVQRFQFEIIDTTRTYNIKATFRNASAYPFYNLYFQYTLSDSADRVVTQRLTQVDLFNPKTGQPNGDGLGDLFDHTFGLEENVSFSSPGMYTLALEQYMRRDTLPFILSVGARVEFVED